MNRVTRLRHSFRVILATALIVTAIMLRFDTTAVRWYRTHVFERGWSYRQHAILRRMLGRRRELAERIYGYGLISHCVNRNGPSGQFCVRA